jgi:agmatinase
MSERQRPDPSADRDFATLNVWDREYELLSDFDLPTYVGPTSFMKLPWIDDPTELARRKPDVAIIGAPFDDAVSHRPGARFGPRAIREAQYTSGSIHSLQLGVEPFEVLDVVDAGDANIIPAWIDRAHALIYRKVRDVAATGAIPIVLGGDHSITWPSATAIAEVRRPGSIGIVHFDAHADTANEDWGVLAGHGTPMRRLIESGAVKGSNFVQVGLRGYWPPIEVFEWMKSDRKSVV